MEECDGWIPIELFAFIPLLCIDASSVLLRNAVSVRPAHYRLASCCLLRPYRCPKLPNSSSLIQRLHKVVEDVGKQSREISRGREF